MSLSFLFQNETPVHPLVKDWQRRLDEGATATLEVYQQPKGIGVNKMNLFLQFNENGQLLPKEALSWDDELNDGLVKLHIKAATTEQEAQRFAVSLRSHLRKLEREYGDGYLNSVLIKFVNEELADTPEIAPLLIHTKHVAPPMDSKTAFFCRDQIENEIRARYLELTKDLHYIEETAQSILKKMIAIYIDERFSISSRFRMGLLQG